MRKAARSRWTVEGNEPDEGFERLARVVKSSEIARLIAAPTQANETDLLFGKIFEECYTTATWIYEKAFYVRGISKKFIRKLAVELKLAGIYSSSLVRKAYRMYSCLVKHGVIGRKPKTMFRRLNDEIVVAAQPDLVDEFYCEFKTYPLDEYAKAQAKVFSWVIEEPIRLVGLVEREDGYFELQEEMVNAEGLKFPNIPPDIGEFQWVCEECDRPLDFCECYFEEEYEYL